MVGFGSGGVSVRVGLGRGRVNRFLGFVFSFLKFF